MNDETTRGSTGGGGVIDAVVIGAGVIGSAIALELQRSGRRVLVVDKGGPVGGGSSSASSSIIRFNYSTLDGVIASWEAMHQWARWADHLGHVDGPLAQFHRIGMLVMLPPGDDQAVARGHLAAAGVPHELLDPAALAARFPPIDGGCYHPPRWPTDPDFFSPAHGQVTALYQPDAGFVDDPQLAARNLMDAARHLGAELRLRTEIVGVATTAGRVSGVDLVDGTAIEAPVVVNAAGPWSSRLTALAGADRDLRIRCRPMRQTIASCLAPAGFRVDDGGAVMADMDLGAYGRPHPGGSFLIGGVEADCDPLEWVDDPDAGSPTPDPGMFEALSYRMARRIPGLGVPHRPQGLASHYDVADDWTPIYDRSCVDGFYLAVGTSGNQFKNAPIVGEMMAHLIDAVEAGQAHDADPVRMTCTHTGLELNLGQFSRLREPAATGGNVWG
ncbi:MAG: NAD(P)/FAD-dependent oxidoreductase [Acidimicrobiales bacterium]